jgi:hypothetical protein
MLRDLRRLPSGNVKHLASVIGSSREYFVSLLVHSHVQNRIQKSKRNELTLFQQTLNTGP